MSYPGGAITTQGGAGPGADSLEALSGQHVHGHGPHGWRVPLLQGMFSLTDVLVRPCVQKALADSLALACSAVEGSEPVSEETSKVLKSGTVKG